MAKKNAVAQVEVAEIAGVLNEIAAPVTETVAPEITAEQLAELELANAQAQVTEDASGVSVTADPAVAVENDDAVTWGALVESVSPEETTEMQANVTAAFSDRSSFERAKDPANSNIQKNLAKYEKQMASHLVAACMVAAEVDVAFINREQQSGKRFNVYAIEKVGDLAVALATGRAKNAINAAVIKSLFAVTGAGMVFNGTAALAAVSDKLVVADKRLAALLTRHTVSGNTAPTQMSSTMAALQTIGAVVNLGTQKAPVYHLTANPVVERLREVYAR